MVRLAPRRGIMPSAQFHHDFLQKFVIERAVFLHRYLATRLQFIDRQPRPEQQITIKTDRFLEVLRKHCRAITSVRHGNRFARLNA